MNLQQKKGFTMKHFITTTELLENVLEENSTEDIENLHVFAKKTDTISMTILVL